MRPFPPRFAFVEIMRAFADWRRRHASGACRLTLYVVDPELYMEIGSGRIDVPELLYCEDVRFWAEIVTPSSGIERRLFQETRTKTLGDIAEALDMSVEHWEVEVSPPPDFVSEVLPLAKKENRDKKVEALGVVPGSTLHFRRLLGEPSTGTV